MASGGHNNYSGCPIISSLDYPKYVSNSSEILNSSDISNSSEISNGSGGSKSKRKHINLDYEYKLLLSNIDDICYKNYRNHNINIISQSDFKDGPLIIEKPGIWKVVEDITLNFNPDNDFMPLDTEKRPAFILGFFAGIIIQCENVCLDLCGHTIAMSQEFALEQRFFSIIELANAPFIPSQGPGDFGSSIKSASYCVIKNGTIGRSSHHGIHGNGAHHIVIKDLIIKDFEIAGIALNGGKYLAFKNLDIGPNWKDVPVLGNYSAARFLPKFCNTLMSKINDGDKNSLQVALNNLLLATKSVRQEFNETGKVTNKLFGNSWGLPDGNNYGILIHPPGVSVNDYIDYNFDGNLSDYIFVNKVHVHDIEVKVNEIVGLSQNNGKGIHVDPSGSIIQIACITNENGTYKPNVLSELQILMAELCNKYGIKIGKLNISNDIIDWSKSGNSISNLFKLGCKYVCNGDSMHHVAKPVHGFRFDGVRFLKMTKCKAVKIGNLGYLGAIVEADMERPKDDLMAVHEQQFRPGYRGSTSVGFNFSHVLYSKIQNVEASDIYSSNGDAIGFRFINGCYKIQLSKLRINKVLAGLKEGKYWYYLNHNGEKRNFKFHKISSIPDAIGIKVEDKSCLVEIKYYTINKLQAPGCEVPLWLS